MAIHLRHFTALCKYFSTITLLLNGLSSTLCLCPKLLICLCEWNWNKHFICPAYLANHGIQKGLPLVCVTILRGAVARALAFLHLAAWVPIPVTALWYVGWVCGFCSERTLFSTSHARMNGFPVIGNVSPRSDNIRVRDAWRTPKNVCVGC